MFPTFLWIFTDYYASTKEASPWTCRGVTTCLEAVFYTAEPALIISVCDRGEIVVSRALKSKSCCPFVSEYRE